MKFQKPSLVLILNGRTDARNMLPLFRSWGHKNCRRYYRHNANYMSAKIVRFLTFYEKSFYLLVI